MQLNKNEKKILPRPGIEPGSLDLQSNTLPTELSSGEDRLMEGGGRGKGEKNGEKIWKRRKKREKLGEGSNYHRALAGYPIQTST